MTKRIKSRNALDGPTIPVARGVVVFKVKASPFYRVRIWQPSERKRITRTTRAKTRVEAVKAAEEFRKELAARGELQSIPKQFTFEHYGDKLVQRDRLRAERGELHSDRGWKDTRSILRNPKRGLLLTFGKMDVRRITTADYIRYLDRVAIDHPQLAPATRNRTAVVFQQVMKLALEEGVISALPDTPRSGSRDNPRAFFRFSPLVPKEQDELRLLLKTAKAMIAEKVSVRGIPITDELPSLINFMLWSFLRPTESELFGLKHEDVTLVRQDDQSDGHLGMHLTLSVNGKTGHRTVVTMEEAFFSYHKVKMRARYLDDYVFFPTYKNRSTAAKIAQRQFKAILERAELTVDRVTNAARSLYSLRHTAICRRLVMSKGKVNIFTLAKNAGTSVDQIERFYAKHLPLSPDMIANLHSYGE